MISSAAQPLAPPIAAAAPAVRLHPIHKTLLLFAALGVLAAMTWQGLTTGGSPDPTRANTSPTAAVLDIGVLVFREGLECILVLAALAFLATLVTWMIAVRIMSALADNVSVLNLQAATAFSPSSSCSSS